MGQRLTLAAKRMSEVDQQDVAALLHHVAILHKASDDLLAKLERENQSCLRESKAMMDLSHRVRDSLSVILGSAWMLEAHGENLDSDRLSQHCSIIRTRILHLLNDLELVKQW